ncbi:MULTISPECIES: ABC transporter ATP-binding protein [Auritidibacter]|uniref:ABC transporter ATP-binding protein n=1 Tax=Auritidibacter ignavus TaxID=678932 RepID=A0AAJ6DBV7_9MICC|nr:MULTISPECIES: ABC transporter ATP-binding protein [Auritidibacter]AXR74723.1 ABC transporter ATP-binding protein [Auritidibacter sp. NML130574]NIH71112.1 iron complex transport system ATP-binding protein [Auritidibacter ignavus]PXA75276.1 cobalamin/Fe(3+)-siderophore ABC transporter ATP-binding protein [Auritidibacter sp. NML100628]PXA78721.1 cobalamin/Fe(3+)-siderophore ABC transporter ATP-binding protein [Auritidibacter sp. NML120636]RMX21473.1 ABC transporter ATP-binding protein [Auritid
MTTLTPDTGTHQETGPEPVLKAEAITVGYGGPAVLKDVSVELPSGKVTSIIGPNGCGKSTLLRTFARLNSLSGGSVEVTGRPITSYSSKEFARTVSLLPQTPVVPEGVTVAELVARGRYAHRRVFGGLTRKDRRIIDQALEQTGVTDLAETAVSELSGGQRQRVWIAMVLAQDSQILLLDEPTTYLDLNHQIELVDLLQQLNRQTGKTIIMVLHELNIAARCSDRIIAMRDGNIVEDGAPVEVLTEANCHDIFGLDAAVLHPEETGTPVVVGKKGR